MPKGYYPQPIRLCSIEGCTGVHWGRGWCKMHYHRWVRHGDPLTKLTGHTIKLIRDSVESRDRSDCWVWPYATSPFGYGFVWFENKMTQVHHVALIMDGTPQPPAPGDWALHSCDNRPCFNPAHLRWGTRADNTADMLKRNRQTNGIRNARAKLTEEQVLLIRKDPRPQRIIGKDFGVCQQTVCLIKQRKLWNHLN